MKIDGLHHLYAQNYIEFLSVHFFTPKINNQATAKFQSRNNNKYQGTMQGTLSMRVDYVDACINPFNHRVLRTALVSTNQLQHLGWQPITAKITAILAASSE